MLTVANMDMVQNFEIIARKFNEVEIYTSGNYTAYKKWIIKLHMVITNL
jgi:hypothetical protein